LQKTRFEIKNLVNRLFKEVAMGIHYNHKSKAGDRKMQKELKKKMKIEARKQKKLDKEQTEFDELEKLTRPDLLEKKD
tara:strand:+ start:9086 stop:9319 length:234 start_codon:yes stop_codon:yes gene_type:complete